MEKSSSLNVFVVKDIPKLNIFKTFDCGQCFRFNPVNYFGHKYEFEGVAFSKYVVFAQDNDNEIYIYNSTEEDYHNIWKKFLSLDVDYESINEKIKDATNSEHMKEAVDYGDGIRILRQNDWECICSFIISQNNNIPRIKKIIESLCSKYGDEHNFNEAKYYSFPSYLVLSNLTEKDIFDLKTGFRAKYILDAAKKISSGEIDLEKIHSSDDFDYCLKELSKIRGIGPKVASCALLFGFEKTEAFPIDVWMKRALLKYFPNGIDLNKLGKTAGIAQQYLFYYEKYNQKP